MKFPGNNIYISKKKDGVVNFYSKEIYANFT